MSHSALESVLAEYVAYQGRKTLLLLLLGASVAVLFLAGLCFGAVRLDLADVAQALFEPASTSRAHRVVWSIRLPNSLAAIVAGAGLAAAGAAMQSVLKNPLASPMTLGVSHAGAFGAAIAVMFLHTGVMQSTTVNAVTISNPLTTSLSAFVFCATASLAIASVAKMRGATPAAIALCGMALGLTAQAATMVLQYFADDTQLAAMVFWTFGDLSRAGWREVAITGAATLASYLFFAWNRWNYNALDAGDEAALGLGVRVGRVRLMTLLAASLLTAVIVSCVGIIGFVGLICPHMVRRFTGDDHRHLLPGSCLAGAALLLAADLVSRQAFAPHQLPVSVLTSLIGGPAFFLLLARGGKW